MILGLGATAFAVVALTYLAHTSVEQRTIRARERVEAELERVSDIEGATPRGQRGRRGRRGVGELRSGYVDSDGVVENPRLVEVVAAATTVGQPVILQSVTPEGMPIIAGAVKLDGGGHAWAVHRIVSGPEMRSMRIAVICLAVAMIVMVGASVQTLVTFDRGAGALRESVVLLAGDLHAVIKRPKLKELAEVAAGLDSLARDLSKAQAEKERLLHELADHERWASLGRVVAGVAHEVRNPLAAIKLRTDLAEGMPDVPASLREDLALIGSEVTRLDRLVRDLLLLADRKPEARPQAPTDLGELTGQRVALLRPWALPRGVTILASGGGTVPLDIDGITRALDNLLRNAVEASPSGEAVKAEVVEDATHVQVTVSDRGVGMTEANAALVFEPFFTTKPGGTGLGLALSRSVAEAHGGTLEYVRDGAVTRFTLVLPKG